MLSTNKMEVRNIRILSNSYRVQAQVMNLPNSRLLWINSYLPNDPSTTTFDSNELLETLNEVKNIIDNNIFDDIVWIGGFNWDHTRTSSFSNIMEKFMIDNNLLDVWEKFLVSHTHIHTDFKSTSIINRILVNERLLNVITDAGALYIGDNPSRHCPIYVKIDAGIIPKNSEHIENQ